MRTTIVGHIATVQVGAFFGMNVDNATGSETELSRKRTGDQVDAFHQMRIDFLTETSDSFRNQDVINSKLEVGVFVANVELTIRILRDAWSPQDDLVERGIRALRLGLNLLLPDTVFRSAQIRYDLVPSLVELPDNNHLV